MKKPFYLVITVLSFIALVNSGCIKSRPIESDIVIYSSYESILNPPDTFQVVYQLRTSTNYSAVIEFDENSVWSLERITARGLNIVWAERADSLDAVRYEIINGETGSIEIGFEGGVRYNIMANRNSSGDIVTLFVEFKKLPDKDYELHSFKI